MTTSKDIDIIFNKQLENNSPLALSKRIEYLIRVEEWIKSNKKIIKEAHYKEDRKEGREERG